MTAFSTTECELHEIINCKTCREQAEAHIARGIQAARKRQGSNTTPFVSNANNTMRRASTSWVAHYDGECFICGDRILADTTQVCWADDVVIPKQVVHIDCN